MSGASVRAFARVTAVAAAASLLAGCRGTAHQSDAAAPPPVQNALVAQAREALKRAETAPLPTPPPPPSPLPRGWKPLPAPEIKPEEIEAIRLLEQAAAEQPGQREPHELLARVLEPYAVRQYERAVEARGKKTPPPAPPDQGVDISPARVARAYRAGVEADQSTTDLIEPLIAFAGRVNDLETMDWGHQELIRRAREKDTTTPRVRYGDFLLQRRKDALAAAEQYRGALMWAPDDLATRAKLADLYLALARQHYLQGQYSGAEVRLREAAKFVGDPASPQGKMLEDYRQRLAAIRR
jgi:hypothetical protein